MFKSLLRCIRRFFSRRSCKPRDETSRRTDHGANIDIEDALAEQLELQRLSGRALSSTASIAAALRKRPREDMPAFSTRASNDEHRTSSEAASGAVLELTPRLTSKSSSRTGERPESLFDRKSPVVSVSKPSKRVLSDTFSSSHGSSVRVPKSVSEDGEPEEETETTREKSLPASERPSELNPRRSSIFDMRSEWI
ncbi:unnamed protein product [Hyaloperonospora brassicae]|uniref:RxLR effector candidate protein n=1 Tax=Hyaloperonospora brassicae TaxID=162125 RepID=A0AAV0U523_HYABA|nr:unnamed protein product [Hyaloperonospora brassicae]